MAEYYAMAEAGILKKEERVDLLDGLVVDPAPPVTPQYYAVVNKLNTDFILALDTRAIPRVRGTIVLDMYNAPEADLVLLRERKDFYRSQTPGPYDVLLVIEVADSSADYDRNEKLPRYARAGIPEVWLTVLPGGCDRGAHRSDGKRLPGYAPIAGRRRSTPGLFRGYRDTGRGDNPRRVVVDRSDSARFQPHKSARRSAASPYPQTSAWISAPCACPFRLRSASASGCARQCPAWPQPVPPPGTACP